MEESQISYWHGARHYYPRQYPPLNRRQFWASPIVPRPTGHRPSLAGVRIGEPDRSGVLNFQRDRVPAPLTNLGSGTSKRRGGAVAGRRFVTVLRLREWAGALAPASLWLKETIAPFAGEALETRERLYSFPRSPWYSSLKSAAPL